MLAVLYATSFVGRLALLEQCGHVLQFGLQVHCSGAPSFNTKALNSTRERLPTAREGRLPTARTSRSLAQTKSPSNGFFMAASRGEASTHVAQRLDLAKRCKSSNIAWQRQAQHSMQIPCQGEIHSHSPRCAGLPLDDMLEGLQWIIGCYDWGFLAQ